jgi:hypothetical protein
VVKKRVWIRLGMGLLMVGAIAGGQEFGKAEEHVSRQTMIHERGSLVMPFDLDKTVHVFETTKDGGIQQVRAKDPKDMEQIHLIQQHLTEEAGRFARGDFSDPGALHGQDMPGLQVLERAGGALTVSYRELPDGGEIGYKTSDPEILKGIHQWFAAQLHDHGADATDKMTP